LKPTDVFGFNLFEFPPSLCRNRQSLKVTTIRDERSSLCPVHEIAAVASRRAIGGKMPGKDRVRRVAAEVVP
jgi:hypothetical protein